MRRIFPAASVLHRSRWMILVWHWRARRHRHFRHDRCMDQEHPLVGLVYIVWLALEPDVDDFDLGQAFGTILATASDNSTTSGADHFPFLKFLLITFFSRNGCRLLCPCYSLFNAALKGHDWTKLCGSSQNGCGAMAGDCNLACIISDFRLEFPSDLHLIFR